MPKSKSYYSENDPFAAAWLRELIADKLIAEGDVDERDIRDVLPRDVRGYGQCHFFAGIGGWSYALRLAGWPDDRPVWTGSCPCQPFSTAGKRARVADERHLWPSFFHLVQCGKPEGVPLFGEQVDAAVRQDWLDLVSDDMEGIGHTVRAVDFPASSVGAPHRRQRAYFVAESHKHERGQEREDAGGIGEGGGEAGVEQRLVRGGDEFVAHSPNLRRLKRRDAEGVEIQGERAERGGEHTTTGHAGELSGGL